MIVAGLVKEGVMKKQTIAVFFSLLTAILCFAAVFMHYKNKAEITMDSYSLENNNSGYTNKKSVLMCTPVVQFCEQAQNCSYNNGLLYLSSEQGLIECDIHNGITTEIISKNDNDHFSCLNLYNGYIYALNRRYIPGESLFDEGTVSYEIVRIDYNTHETKTLYCAEGENIIGCVSMSYDGIIYFVEGKYDETINDKNGFNDSFSLYSLNSESLKKEIIESCNTYYIYDNNLYYTKFSPANDTLRLFYASLDDTSKAKDTGIDVCADVSMGDSYMIYPVGEYVYYTDVDHALCMYNIENKKTEKIIGFDDSKKIYYFGLFDSRLIILVREQMPDGYWCYVLYYLDEANTPVRITGDDKLNDGKKYWFEYIDCICTFPGNDEIFALVTYNQYMDEKVYIIDKELQLTMVMQSGEWDYLSFEKMKDGIQG